MKNTEQTQVLTYLPTVRQINKHRFGVDSQSDHTKTYTVQRVPHTNTWYCDCKHFHKVITRKTQIHCYHISAVIMFREQKYKEKGIKRPRVDYCCTICNSTRFNKDGTAKMTDGSRKQMYECVNCGHRSSLRSGRFAGNMVEPKVISDALDLFGSGVSYRKMVRIFERTYGIKLNPSTPQRWLAKYTKIMTTYLDGIIPEISNVECVDEMSVNAKHVKKTAKGFRVWVWSIIDPHTRFLIATRVSEKRSIDDARRIFQDGKKIAGDPDYIISDRLAGYAEAIRKEYRNRVAHLYTKSIQDGFTNRPIERWHNEARENLNTRRGLDNKESVQTMMEFLKIHHNFVKPHMGLGGRTPAQAAGIDLNLGPDKFLDLIEMTLPRPDYVKALGKRIEYVDIITEENAVRIVQKSWIPKRTWRQINDILSLYHFERVQYEHDGFWIRSEPPVSLKN